MSDDTTTWLKKNPSINPLRRSLKTSLRFNVPSSDMNSSIMSNPDKAKDQGLFIPRMLQRSNMQMRKSRGFEFKVPEMVVSKPGVKKEAVGVKHKKIPTPNRARKSFLPIPRTKEGTNEKVPTKGNLPRPSMLPGGSGRRTAKRELLKKVVELSELKRKEEAESQMKAISGDSSVLRSILKKRASLRRSSQISSKKPKAKKVLFDGFENSDGEKENEADLSSQNDFNTALDEPTVFLNFPNGTGIDESPFEPVKQPLNWTVEEAKLPQEEDIRNIIKLWESYKENLENIQVERNSVEESFECLLQQSLSFQKQYETYKVTAGEMFTRLTRLGKELEDNLKKVMTGGRQDRDSSTPKCKRPGRRGSDKIKLSDRSKAIKKSSGRKSVPLLRKEFLEDSFSITSKNGFLDK